jgi:hypothetical protein
MSMLRQTADYRIFEDMVSLTQDRAAFDRYPTFEHTARADDGMVFNYRKWTDANPLSNGCGWSDIGEGVNIHVERLEKVGRNVVLPARSADLRSVNYPLGKALGIIGQAKPEDLPDLTAPYEFSEFVG